METEPLVNVVSTHAERRPDAAAIRSGARTISYAALWGGAVRVAAWFAAEGVQRGSRVALTAEPGDPWFAVGYLAAHLSGAIAAPIDGKAASATRREILEQLDPALIVAGDKHKELIRVADQRLEHRPLSGAARQPSSNDIADVLFTSGATGRPKGVVLTHANISAAAASIVQFIGNNGSDREVVTVPLSHSFGLGRLRCALLVGGTVILVPGLTFPALVFDALKSHAATGLACVPAGVSLLLKWGAERFRDVASHLRYMEIGSAPMPLESKQTLMQLLPDTRICMHYGLTEASRSAFLEFHSDAERLDSIGRPAPNVSIRICSESGAPLPPGSTGRIHIKARTVMKGYWRDEDNTRRVLSADGWLDTGDLGHADADGYIYLDGRIEDVINVGGRKVYPAMIEAAACEFAGVKECACVAWPDPRGITGESPVLYIVPSAPGSVNEQSLIAFLAARVEAFAVPSAVFMVEGLPKTSSGKLLRSVLRATAGSREAASIDSELPPS